MKKKVSRFIIIAFGMLLLMGALIYQLSTLTITNSSDLVAAAESRRTRALEVKGTRGKIMDRNGIVLAYSENCYNVEFFRDPEQRSTTDSALYTEALIRAVKIIEDGGGKTIDTSYIRMGDDGKLAYDWGVKSQKAIEARYKNFRDAMNFKDEDITAEEAYITLRKSWQIPEEMSFEDAIKIISIRQEVLLNNYRAYQPITIAYDVSMDVVAQIEMYKDQLPGLQTAQSTTRVYPRGTTAAHIVGYLSRSADIVSTSTLEAMRFPESEYSQYTEINLEDGSKQVDMTKLGYSYSDMIGVSGIERTMEYYLTGSTLNKQGSHIIEVNKYGSMIRELESTGASDGDDVMLTIDLPLQQVTEEALKNVIDHINEIEQATIARREAEDDGYYSRLTLKREKGIDSIQLAKTGAIVVMDIHTGKVLSMASYPSFDPNMFISGISDEQAEQIFNSEEAAETTPMRNKAISARSAPGSIFKMVTGLAGLMEGKVGLTEHIDDMGYYYLVDENGELIKENAPKCHTKYPSSHHDQDITVALKNSCNYYFYEVANRLGIQLLNDWSGKLGLTSSTGIELSGESVGMVGGQKVLYDNTLPVEQQKTSLPILVYTQICDNLRRYLNTRSMEVDETAVKNCARKLLELQDGTVVNKGSDVRRILREELGLPEGITSAMGWTSEITSSLNELQWKPTITIRSGIGQGVSLVTPIAVARYVSALANGGTVYEAHVVDRILDENGALVKQIEPTVYNKIEAPDEYWAAIRRGLEGVVSPEDHGTAAEAFSKEFGDAGYLSMISGKTGTAQTGSNPVDIENTSWFVVYTPRDEPEIAIVVCVPNGYSGSSSALAVEQITKYYIDKKNAAAPENLVGIDGLVP